MILIKFKIIIVYTFFYINFLCRGIYINIILSKFYKIKSFKRSYINIIILISEFWNSWKIKRIISWRNVSIIYITKGIKIFPFWWWFPETAINRICIFSICNFGFKANLFWSISIKFIRRFRTYYNRSIFTYIFSR